MLVIAKPDVMACGLVIRFLLPTPLHVQVVHQMPRRVSVCVRPNCSTPPSAPPFGEHFSGRQEGGLRWAPAPERTPPETTWQCCRASSRQLCTACDALCRSHTNTKNRFVKTSVWYDSDRVSRSRGGSRGAKWNDVVASDACRTCVARHSACVPSVPKEMLGLSPSFVSVRLSTGASVLGEVLVPLSALTVRRCSISARSVIWRFANSYDAMKSLGRRRSEVVWAWAGLSIR